MGLAGRARGSSGAALAALLAPLLVAAAPPGWRASGEAFGEPARIEVRNLDAAAAETVLRAAMAELAATEAEAAALAVRLNGAAGREPIPIDGPALAMLRRALEFCDWSEGAHGPLGGVLYELWQRSLPSAAVLTAARESARCERLEVDERVGTARLAAGSRVDLRGFASGWAVDRAADLLRQRGAANALIRVGAIARGLGPGPSGAGWTPETDLPPEWLEPLTPARLEDRAMAVAGREPPRVIAGDRYSVHLNLRDGRPARGVAATIAVSELAIDAQALAITMLVLGQREGMMRLGALRPPPSVVWLLGTGTGRPLVTTHHWTAVD